MSWHRSVRDHLAHDNGDYSEKTRLAHGYCIDANADHRGEVATYTTHRSRWRATLADGLSSRPRAACTKGLTGKMSP